jgi:hypothetical protein
VFIEKYKSGLQKYLREAARTAPSGKRWTSLKDLIKFCTLQWPSIQARLGLSSNKFGSQNNGSPSVKVGGKRKAMSPNRPRKSSKASSGAGGSGSFPRLSDEQKVKNLRDNLCHLCGSPDHFVNKCPDRWIPWKDRKGKGGKQQKDFS